MARPTVVGWYIPGDRSSDYDGSITDPVTGEVTYPPSMTKQEMVAECDINNIVKEFQLTGQIAHMSQNAARGAYLDLPDPIDYQEALNIVQEGSAAFASLPSAVRSRFENDPEKFLEFVSDPNNAEEMVTLGLLSKKAQSPAEQSGAEGTSTAAVVTEGK